MPAWPRSFENLGAAREHVRRVCYSVRFKYNHHPGVAPYRFEMFVNFNTARHAFEAGKFECAHPTVGPGRVSLAPKTGCGASVGIAQRSTMAVTRRPSPARSSVQSKSKLFDVSAAPYTYSSTVPRHSDARSDMRESVSEDSSRSGSNSSAATPSTSSFVPSIELAQDFDLIDLREEMPEAAKKLDKIEVKAKVKVDPFEVSDFLLCGSIMC